MTPSRIEPATFQFVALYFDRLSHSVPPSTLEYYSQSTWQVVHVHAMKAQRSGGTAPRTLISASGGLEWSHSRPDRFSSGETSSCTLEQEEKWLQIYFKKKKTSCPGRESNHDPSVVRPVAQLLFLFTSNCQSAISTLCSALYVFRNFPLRINAEHFSRQYILYEEPLIRSHLIHIDAVA
jgi:hypothetical protein